MIETGYYATLCKEKIAASDGRMHWIDFHLSQRSGLKKIGRWYCLSRCCGKIFYSQIEKIEVVVLRNKLEIHLLPCKVVVIIM